MDLKQIITSLFEKRNQIEQLANFQKEAFYKPYLGHTVTICDTVTDIARDCKIVTEDYSSVDNSFVTRYSGNKDNKIVTSIKDYDGDSFTAICVRIHCGYNINKTSNVFNNYDKFHQQICNITGTIKSVGYGRGTIYLELENCSVSIADKNWLTEDYLGLPKETETYKNEKVRLQLLEEEKKREKELYERNLNRSNRKKDLIIVGVLGIIAFLIFRACS